MNKPIYGLLIGLIILSVSCKDGKTNDTAKSDTMTQNETDKQFDFKDWHSQSNANQIHPEHLSLDIDVNFDKHQITGSATWDIKPNEGIKYAIFDTQQMTIDSVEYADGSPASFEMGKKDSILGSALKISLKPDTKKLKIFYTTGENATALQWMKPSQTFGKKAPYLYTQGETIYTRTWVPTPDGPGYRFTYDATVKVPKGLMALMSAENPQEASKDGIYHFKMNQPIPAYLMALAVGDIGFNAIDDRTGVYAEPVILDKAYNELDGVGKMVDDAEDLYGKYRWGRYDVLILPSGFPMGGMENPRLTFATPTILAGDKSLVNLIAHELAHSWSGNLVTNATWDDFWLNEGATVYFERRITEAEHGKDYAAMLWALGEKILEKDVESLGEKSRHTWLEEDLKGKDPEEGFTDIPYEKGAALFLKIEQTVGREKFDTFLNNYFDAHAFQAMTTEKFLDYLNKNLLDGHENWKKEINIDAWVYAPGIPDNYPEINNPRFKKVDTQIADYLSGKTPAADLKTEDWSTYEWLRFLQKLPDDLSQDQMKELDKTFNFTHSGNSEIADVWFLHALKTDYKPAYAEMKKFLHVTGRMKFLEPLYEEMMKTDKGQEMAKEIYKIARPNYHPLTQKGIDKIVKE
ncbi:MAG: M1 family metallopeptidase [Aequorivita sp.]